MKMPIAFQNLSAIRPSLSNQIDANVCTRPVQIAMLTWQFNYAIFPHGRRAVGYTTKISKSMSEDICQL